MEDIKISDFLRRGTILKTQVQDSIEWVANAVIDMYSDTDEMALIYDERYSGNLVLVGDAIKINYVEGETQYFIEAWINNIQLEPVKLMMLKIVSIKKLNNLRKDERFSVNYAAKIAGYGNPNGVFGVITNLSISGLAFITRSPFFVGETVNISIFLPAKSFFVDAEIVRVNETAKGSEYGVRFVRNDDVAIEELEGLIDDIKEREDRLSHIMGFEMK